MRQRDLRGARLLYRSMLSSLLRSFALVLALGATASAQIATGVVSGRVRLAPDTTSSLAVNLVERPATAARVSIVGSGLGAIVDADGHFAIPGVPAGARTLRIRLIGFRTIDRIVQVAAGDTLRIDETLTIDPHVLGPVSVAARSVDQELFETRPSVGTIALSATAIA